MAARRGVARRGQVFDPYIPGYRDLRRTPKMQEDMHRRAVAIAEAAKASAPVETGAYKASIEVRDVITDGRATSRVLADTPHAIWVELATNNLGRAMDAAAEDGGGGGGGSALVWYTTRAGVRRRATRAQVASWTRGGG